VRGTLSGVALRAQPGASEGGNVGVRLKRIKRRATTNTPFARTQWHRLRATLTFDVRAIRSGVSIAAAFAL